MDIWEVVAERKIQEAMDEGAFEHLPGKGKPLPRDDSPFEDPSMGSAYRLLRDNGFSPPWIETGSQIEALVESARRGLCTSWSAYQAGRPSAASSVEKAKWQAARETFCQHVADINRRIVSYNVSVPSASFQKTILNVEREIELIMRVTRDCSPQLPSDFTPPVQTEEVGSLRRVVRLITKYLGRRFSMNTGIVFVIACAATQTLGSTRDRVLEAVEPASTAQTNLIVLPQLPVTVAPNQPGVEAGSTVGIINALCDVTLNVVGCGFPAQRGSLTCDTNGDGVPELIITLTDVTNVNANLVRVTIPALSPGLPGTGFPLACCGGLAKLTLSRTVSEGDDNVFGEFTQSVSTTINLGERAPVLISASPADGDCSVAQNLLIPGACLLRADGSPNVTSVFAVEKGNPNNVVQSSRFVILSPNLIDALFEFGSTNDGKTFLIFASGQSGTSRNLTELPVGTDPDCPLGNEQGVAVAFTCLGPGSQPNPSPDTSLINSCKIERNSSGAESLVLTTTGVTRDIQIIVGATRAKKVKFKKQSEAGLFKKLIIKGRFCEGLPGAIVVVSAEGEPEAPFMCAATCSTAP